jgi:hypothetical protein
LARQFREETRKLQAEKEQLQNEFETIKTQLEELKANIGNVKGPAVTTGWPTDIAATGTSSDNSKKMEQIIRDKLQEVTKLKSENSVSFLCAKKLYFCVFWRKIFKIFFFKLTHYGYFYAKNRLRASKKS